MKRDIVLTVAVLAVSAVMFYVCGCASIMAMNRHNAQVALYRVEASGGRVYAGVDVRALSDGYWGAWRASPGQMTVATLWDGLTIAAAGYAAQELTKDDDQPAEFHPTYKAGGDIYIINAPYTRTRTEIAQ